MRGAPPHIEVSLVPAALWHRLSPTHTVSLHLSSVLSECFTRRGDAHTHTHTHTHRAVLPWGKPRKVRVLRKGFLEAEAAKLTLKEEDSGRMPQGTGVTYAKAQWRERASGFRGNKSSLCRWNFDWGVGFAGPAPKDPWVLEHRGGGSAGNPLVKIAAYENPSGCSVI